MISRLAPLCAFGLLAAAPAHAATLVDAWEFNGSLAATNGGPAAVLEDPTDLTATGVTQDAVAPGEGVQIDTGALGVTGTYAVEMLVTFDAVDDYAKLIDFKNLANDEGVYAEDFTLYFYNEEFSAQVLQHGVAFHVVLQRDAGTDLLEAYIDGAFGFSFVDSGDLGVFDGAGWFMRDDDATGNDENATGFLDYIRIYTAPLTAGEIETLATDALAADVPVPAAAPLLLLGLGGFALMRRRA